MQSALSLEAFEESVRRVWRRLTGPLDELDRRMLLEYLKIGEATPYQVARRLGVPVSKAYRRAHRLAHRRLLLTRDDREQEGKLGVSIKGCIALYAYNLIDRGVLAACASRVWDVNASAEEVLGIIYLVGVEAERRGLDIRSMTMCRAEEASIHAVRLLREAIVEYASGERTLGEILDEKAAEHSMPPRVLRAALRLALRILSRLLPLTLKTPRHKIVLLVHGNTLLPLVVECNSPKPCIYYERCLGVGCPEVVEEVRQRLGPLLGAYIHASPHDTRPGTSPT